MATTYEPIATTTLASAAATITFSSIAATWTDLRIIVVWRGTQSSSSNNIFGRFNSDTGSNYSTTDLSGNGASATSFRSANQTQMNFGYVSSPEGTNWGLTQIDIFNYAGSTNKTVLCAHSYDRNGSGYVQRNVNLWRNTSAITTVQILSNVNNFSAGTTATIYGIKAA